MQTAESETSDQSKRPLVSWRPAIHPTNLAGGLFPDFQVLLFGIRADDGEHWASSAIVRREDARTIITNSRVYELRGPINKTECLKAGYSLEFISEFQNGFPTDWYQLLMDHVDQLKLAQADKILNGDLPPTREVQQMRNFLLSQVNDRYRSANEETVALDIQPSTSSASIETQPRASLFEILETNQCGLIAASSSNTALSASSKAPIPGSKSRTVTVDSKVQSKQKKDARRSGGGVSKLAAIIANVDEDEDEDEDIEVTSTVTPTQNSDRLESNNNSSKKRKSMSSGKGSANRRRCMSPPPIPPIRISRVGRVIKPPLNRSTGERIVYDFHGNPLRACASVTVRDDGEPEISPKLTAICSTMQLRTPEGPKQKQRASLLVPKSKTSTKRRGANSGRKGGGKRRLVDYSDSEDSYMAELDQIVLTDESDNEEILNLNTNAGNVIERPNIEEESDDDIESTPHLHARMGKTGISKIFTINSPSHSPPPVKESVEKVRKGKKSSKVKSNKHKKNVRMMKAEEKPVKKSKKKPSESKMKKEVSRHSHGGKRRPIDDAAAAQKKKPTARKGQLHMSGLLRRNKRDEPIVEIQMSSTPITRSTKTKEMASKQGKKQNGLFNDVAELLTPLNSLPLRQRGGKNATNKDAKKLIDSKSTSQPLKPRRRRWNEHDTAQLLAILKVAVNPCTDNDWEIIAGQMGPGWTGGDCRAQAERLEWKGPSTSKTMESAGPSYTTPKNGFDILKPLTNGPNHHMMRKSRRSADLDASYFAKMNDSLDDLLKAPCNKRDSIFLTNQTPPGQIIRCQRKPFIPTIVDQLNSSTASEGSSFLS